MKLRCAFIALALAAGLGVSVAPAAAYGLSASPDAVIGMSEGAMSPKRTSASYGARVTETTLGNFVSDALRMQSGATVAVIQGGHLAQSLPGGEITVGAAYQVFAENLPVGVAEIPASLFFKVLEHAVGQIAIDDAERINPESGFDGFLQVSGFCFSYDASQPAGERIREVVLDNGSELSPLDEGKISLAAPEDLLSGALGFEMLRGAAYSPAGSEAELLAAYIAGLGGEIKRPEIGRIEVVGAADYSIYRNLQGEKYLPYLILIALFIALPQQRYRKPGVSKSRSKHFLWRGK